MAWLVEEGGTIKGRSVKREAGGGIGGDIENQDPEMPDPEAKKKIRLYDQMRLEALRLERDAQRALLENAQIEGDKLKKEASILDVQLEIMKIDLAIRKEEALKVGVVFEMADAGIAVKISSPTLFDSFFVNISSLFVAQRTNYRPVWSSCTL